MKKDKYANLSPVDLYIRVKGDIDTTLDKGDFVIAMAFIFLFSSNIHQNNTFNILLLSLLLVLCLVSIYLYYNYKKIKFNKYQKRYSHKMDSEDWNEISKKFRDDIYRTDFTKTAQIFFAVIVLAITLVFSIKSNNLFNTIKIMLNGSYIFIMLVLSSDILYYFRNKSYLNPISKYLKEDILNKHSEVTVEEFDQIEKLEQQHFNLKNRKSINHLQKDLKKRLNAFNQKHKNDDITFPHNNEDSPLYDKKMAYQKALVIIKDQKRNARLRTAMIIIATIVLIGVIPYLIFINM